MYYYSKETKSRYFKVKLSGEITKCDNIDTKVAATEITILEEITDIFDEVIETTEWRKNDNVLDLLYYSEGFARVQRSDYLWNFIDKDGKYLSNEWFNYLDNFQEGFARLQRSDYLYNFIDKHGKFLSKEWFICVDNSHDGFALVQRSDKLWNFIDKNGKILSDEWFYWVDNFQEGFAKVQRIDKKYNFIDKNGKFLSNEWFNYLDENIPSLQVLFELWCERNDIIVDAFVNEFRKTYNKIADKTDMDIMF